MEYHCYLDDDMPPFRRITDIPEEVLELVFSHLSPYADVKSVMLVCKQWHRVVSGLIQKLQRNFHQMLRIGEMRWEYVSNCQTMSITDRHSHSSCYFEQSMYVFGGCSATSTTFNDLWRFDLAMRQWVRPLAMGTYPSPKACATMVVYKDSLVLFGGWSRPTPMPLHQAPRFFSELHMYTPLTNRWSQIMAVSNDSQHRLAGHSASIVGDTMVIFGGSHDPGVGCNDVWLFDFIETVWKKVTITGKKPNPRYGQSQKTLDKEHILIVGGCGGANQTFSDAWLLNLTGDEGTWEEITIANSEFCPTQMWSHPACMVDDLAVYISKNSRVRGSNPEAHNVLLQNRVWIPPLQPPLAQPMGPAVNPPPHHPHIPPPPAFPSMAAFQRRRDNWGGGFGPPIIRDPPNIEQRGQVHGADNPNIQDVQRLRAAQSRPTARGGQRASAAMPSPLLQSPQSTNFTSQSPRQNNPSVQSSTGGCSTDGSCGEASARVRNQSQPGASGSSLSSQGSSSARANGFVLPRPNANVPTLNSDLDNDGAVVEEGNGGALAPRPGFPSVRPNAMHNRQRQLDMLRKHEHLLRSRNNTHNNNHSASNINNLPRNPMVIHVLDLSEVITNRTATWLPVRETYMPGSPEETIFYSLVEGRGELVLFGGIHNNQNSMQRVNSPPASTTHSVSNGLYIISPRQLSSHEVFVKHR